MRRLLFLTITVSTLTVTLAAAQSLGDVAKQEEARRKAVKSPGKTYTGDSLRPDNAAAPAAAAPAAGSNKPATPEPSTSAAASGQQEPKKDEAYWRKRISSERDALDRSKTFADALQSRINALTTDFTARDDPFQRSQIGLDRQKALAELDRVKKEIVDQTKAISDTQEEARKAGVPAGWLR